MIIRSSKKIYINFDLSAKKVQKCQFYPPTKVRLRLNWLNAALFFIFRTLLTYTTYTNLRVRNANFDSSPPYYISTLATSIESGQQKQNFSIRL